MTIESCTDQWIYGQVREFVGAEPGSVGGDVRVKVPAKLTTRLNDVPLYFNHDLRPTVSAHDQAVGTPGPIVLQGSADGVEFRNVWLVPER